MFYHETAFLATFLLLSCYLLATLFGIPPYILRISFEYQWRDNDPLPFQYPSIIRARSYIFCMLAFRRRASHPEAFDCGASPPVQKKETGSK